MRSYFTFYRQVEVDKSYFYARRVKGLRGRNARVKTIVSGLLKCNDKVCKIVPNGSGAILQGIIKGHVCLESILHSDGRKGYDGLVDVGYQKHFRVEHGNNEYGDGVQRQVKTSGSKYLYIKV